MHNFKKFQDVTVASIKKKLIEYYDKLIFNCKLQVTRKEKYVACKFWGESGAKKEKDLLI